VDASAVAIRVPGSAGGGFNGCRLHRITWENAGRFLGWDPFTLTAQEDANVGALRARAVDVDVTRMPRAEWKARNEAAGIGVF